MRDALREQHPEWIEPDGECPTCHIYETRFAELLARHVRKNQTDEENYSTASVAMTQMEQLKTESVL
jgi:hypothetical protein